MAQDQLTLAIERPAAGGRMIARADGRIVLVSGGIPGERVRAAVEHVRGGVIYARAVTIEDASADRRPAMCDPACGGSTYAYIGYPRQLALKAEIVADAFKRIARLPLDAPVPVRPSPEEGYRMRARLHVRGAQIGFFREGSHELCDAAATRQLLPETFAAIRDGAARLRRSKRAAREIEVGENISGSARAVLVELAPDDRPTRDDDLLRAFESPAMSGVVVRSGGRTLLSRGSPYLTDVLALNVFGQTGSLTLRRHIASFFQGNRFLLLPLIETVVSLLPAGRLIDLYAGVGVFGLAFAALGRGDVIAVEGDRHGGDDLAHNAREFGARVQVHAAAVERHLAAQSMAAGTTVLVDPPRTGLSREVSAALAASGAPRIVYVSCDVATLARDARRLADAGYTLHHIEAFDLFPNTAHVETVAVLSK
jgi:23S rRNA (uracil1939-C5)-methyltransferase